MSDLRHAVVGLGDAGRGERVGGDDVCAGAEISEVDRAHRAGAAQVEEIVIAADLAIPRIEARPAIALLVETQCLDHRPHGAVEDKNAFSRKLTQCRLFFWPDC